jgi:hypothetical protein
MTKEQMRALTIGALLMLQLACKMDLIDSSKGDATGGSTNRSNISVLTFEISDLKNTSNQVEFNWKVMNTGTAGPLYIYSSLLENPDFAEIALDPIPKLIEVRFLRLQPVQGAPYFFPETQFKRILPGETITGHFVIRDVQLLLSKEGKATKSGGTSPTPDTWSLQALVAYGEEIESVQTKLKGSEPSDTHHPINPVVNWQKIARSNLTKIRL